MIIIETCPKCGHDLTDLVIATYPPIPQKKCYGCGWEWTGEPEQIIRRPFGGNNINIINQPSLNDYLNSYNLNDYLNSYNLEDSIVSNFEQSACINCPSNPKNGGSGICHCTLGQMHIAY